jgi:uncharacterized protein (DUF58 family)
MLGRVDLYQAQQRVRRRFPTTLAGRRVVIDVQKQEQFSEAWLVLAAILTLFGIGFRRQGLLLIALSLLTIVLVSWLWNRLALWGVSYRRFFSERRAFCGEMVEVTLQVDNRKLLPLSWLRVEDTFPTDLPLEGGEVVISAGSNLGTLSTFFSLNWYERRRRRYRLHCTQRGFYAFGPVTLESGDLFGLFRSQERQEKQEWLIVYPKVLPLAELGLPAKNPFGEIKAQKRIFEDPSRTIGVRDYQPQDGLRRIHWKATARHQRLQAKDYEPATSIKLIVFLNVATLRRHWMGVIPELLEKAVSVTASIASYGIAQRWPVGVIANGALPRSDQPGAASLRSAHQGTARPQSCTAHVHPGGAGGGDPLRHVLHRSLAEGREPALALGGDAGGGHSDRHGGTGGHAVAVERGRAAVGAHLSGPGSAG